MQGFKVLKALKVQRARCRARRSLIGRKSNSKSDSNSAGGLRPCRPGAMGGYHRTHGKPSPSLRSLRERTTGRWPGPWPPAGGLPSASTLDRSQQPARAHLPASPTRTYPSAEQRRVSAAQALALPQLSGRRQAATCPGRAIASSASRIALTASQISASATNLRLAFEPPRSPKNTSALLSNYTDHRQG